MSGHHYAQATSEESTELVTNRANVKPLHWNAATAGYDEQPSFESQSSANLVSNFSNLQLSSQNSSFIAPVSSHYSQFSGGATHFPNVHSESHVSQNREIAETQRPAVPDQHLRWGGSALLQDQKIWMFLYCIILFYIHSRWRHVKMWCNLLLYESNIISPGQFRVKWWSAIGHSKHSLYSVCIILCALNN